MSIRERAMILTGMAFPLGSILGVLFGRATAPSSGGGFGDIIYIIMWFLFGAPLLTSITYFWSTRRIEWEREERTRAAITIGKGIFFGTGALFLLIFVLSRGANGLWLIVGFPLTAGIVTYYARKALKV